MRRFLRKYIVPVIALCAFIVIGIIYWRFHVDDRFVLGLLVSTVTLYLGIIRFKIEEDKMFKELFYEFNSRYDSKYNDLLNSLKSDKEKVLCQSEKNLVIDYLNLSSEEFLWYQRNRIPEKVWKAWRAGLVENLKIDQVREVYDQEIENDEGKASYYGLVEEIKKYRRT